MLDLPTALATRAVVLSVMAVVFATAWASERRCVFWRNWLLSSVVDAIGLFMLMIGLSHGVAYVTEFGQILLVAGMGFSWQAARQFGQRRSAWLWPVILPVAVSCGTLIGGPTIVKASAWLLSGVAIMLQVGAIMWEYWRDRKDGCLSRYWLVLAYGAFIAMNSFAVFNLAMHLGDGKVFDRNDLSMQLHVWLSVVHTISAGVFQLSLGFERNARELRRLSLTDALTGLANRRAFEERHADLRADAKIRTLTLGLIDIDHFKQINDRYGHAAGDQALQACATILQAVLDRDTMLARVGGEEFAILMPNRSPLEANGVMDKVRAAVACTRIAAGAHSLAITVSIGLYSSARGEATLDMLLHRADAALYEAKRTGRDRVIAAV